MKLLVLILGLSCAGFAANHYLPDLLQEQVSQSSVPTEGLFATRLGLLKVTLIENGSLVAKDSSKVNADVRGDAKITWLIEEGESVEEGDLLCKLDPTEQQDDLEERELDIVQAQANLDTAVTDKEIQETQNESDIEKADINLEKAGKQLERYTEGDAPKDRRNLEVLISEAQTNHTKAKKKYEDSKTLVERDFINRLLFEEDEIAYERRGVQLEGAKRDMELFEQYTFPMTLKERQVAVSEAQRSVDTVAKRAASSLRQKEVAVDQYEKRLEKLEKQRDELVERIEKMTLHAPIPGIVIYGDPRRPWRRENIRVGGEIWGDTTVITLPDLRVMQVKLRVHEADISKLSDGQRVSVSMDSYPGLVLEGAVTRIATIASGDNDWDEEPEVRKFDVEVTVDSEGMDVELKPGVSAKAEIFIEEKQNVLFIPLQCVFQESGKYRAWVLADSGEPEAVEVKPGLSNEAYVEILEGLVQGQRVLLYNPNLPSSVSEDEDDENVEGVSEDGGPEASGANSPATGSDTKPAPE
jgi:multidrug efflux pump subunit AcrA (membrane-fusion protein)